ncbi:type I-F CRISPR-associated protein Csy2 [Verminephrobacter eiseniae]|uniref:type I-F CRISPR-associated protein Csy2 n=1 Tax=Verminephrobacter eiseniae TaxID=364317 RepID=UPI0022387456|nr:type I-F CRISPR-associated protein Csy2 [Verminephrobacter eiseniae]MCW5236212.1 type I-F CRISPR-associated protein Csy2 [Verminephrobacter eiseniae]
MTTLPSKAILVLPHLRVQNANAVSSPLTHGFPSITAFMGLMWALERKLAQEKIALHLQAVGVICHHHQEQVAQGFVRTFNLTRNPVDERGDTAAIVEEGRIHLDITLLFVVTEKRTAGESACLGNEEQMQGWASAAGAILAQMRVAGGTLLPSPPAPGKRRRPWMAVLDEEGQARAEQFRLWRRQWLPGFALVGRDHLLSDRLAALRVTKPETTLLDAWLHAARRNREPVSPKEGEVIPADGKQLWEDPWRRKGSGWTVPIPVGYAALAPGHPAGTVQNARDMSTPLRFVESVYSFGEWISPHRLSQPEELWWYPETDQAKGLYRCRNGHATASENNNQDWDIDSDDDH